jgi:hypothetical protein
LSSTISAHVYEVGLRRDHSGVDLILDGPPFGRPWYGELKAIRNAIGYAKFYGRSRDAVIHTYDEEGNMIETHPILSVRSNGFFPKTPER